MKSIIIYESHFELMKNLTNEQAGSLIKAIGDYSSKLTQDNPNNPDGYLITDPLVLGIFIALKRDFDLQHQNYVKKCESNKENGKKGGRPKTQDNPNNPSGYLETQPNPKNLKDKDKDKDKDKVILDTSYSSSTSTSNEFYNLLDYTIKPTPEIANELDNILIKLKSNG